MLFHLQALDYESKRDYEFRVEVRNTYLDARFIHGLQFKDYATVKVTVEDVDEPPVFTRNPYIIEVHEDTAAGSFVGVVSARDPDADNKPVKYATGHGGECLDGARLLEPHAKSNPHLTTNASFLGISTHNWVNLEKNLSKDFLTNQTSVAVLHCGNLTVSNSLFHL